MTGAEPGFTLPTRRGARRPSACHDQAIALLDTWIAELVKNGKTESARLLSGSRDLLVFSKELLERGEANQRARLAEGDGGPSGRPTGRQRGQADAETEVTRE